MRTYSLISLRRNDTNDEAMLSNWQSSDDADDPCQKNVGYDSRRTANNFPPLLLGTQRRSKTRLRRLPSILGQAEFHLPT